MHLSVPWAIALVVALAVTVVALVGIGACAGVVRAPHRALAHVAHLLGGGLAGFVALAMPPAMPVLAAIVGMLGIRAIDDRRPTDVGLLLVGLGTPWVLLLGAATLAARLDPAVSSSDTTGLLIGAGVVVVAGVGIAVAGASGRPSRWRRPPR